MPGRPVFLSDNVFNPRIYSGHALSASSADTDKDVLFLSSGRRLRTLTGWFASALNTDAYVQSIFDQPRAFDLLFIDRDHNLAGETLSVSVSDDGFTTSTTLVSQVVPSSPYPMAHLLDGDIVVTNEGALLWYLGLQVAWEVRVEVAAMGAGLRPEIAGLMLGLSWRPERQFLKPYSDGRYNLTHTIERSPLGTDASGETGRYRAHEMRFRMESWEEHATALYPLEELFTQRKPTVFVPNDEQAERAFLLRASPGQQGWEVPPDRYLPEWTLRGEEMEPALI